LRAARMRGVCKNRGCPRLHLRPRQGMGLVEASAFSVDAHDLSA